MNIKITKEISEVLLHNTLDTLEFGNTSGKDRDLLHIVIPNPSMDQGMVDINHSLFYKDTENEIDHIYITPRGFVNGIITGSNTLFFEVLCDGLLEGTCLEFLEEYIEAFMTYKLMKAFIGIALRDLKQSRKPTADQFKKEKWSLDYTNMVRKFLGEDTTTFGGLSKDSIGYVRDLLNEAYEDGDINFSVPVDIYTELLRKVERINSRDNRFCVDLSPYYYNTWSENKL
jgi:hypothetical protein